MSPAITVLGRSYPGRLASEILQSCESWVRVDIDFGSVPLNGLHMLLPGPPVVLDLCGHRLGCGDQPLVVQLREVPLDRVGRAAPEMHVAGFRAHGV
jgi:hypothetical protein